MARSVAEITQTIYSTYVTERAAAGLPADNPLNWSITSRKRLWVSIVAMATFVVETFFDLFKNEVENFVTNERPPTLIWWADKFKNYQHGFTLIADTDKFDNTGKTNAEIEASKLIKYAVVIPVEDQFGRIKLRGKIAGESGDDLAQLSTNVVNGCKFYAERFKPAGRKFILESLPPDSLKLVCRVFYNPIVLDANGNRNDGTESDVVKKTIKRYLKNIGFQGVYNPEYHEDFVEKLDGIFLMKIDKAEARYGTNAYTIIDVDYIPDAGWLRILDDAHLQITMIAQNA